MGDAPRVLSEFLSVGPRKWSWEKTGLPGRRVDALAGDGAVAGVKLGIRRA